MPQCHLILLCVTLALLSDATSVILLPHLCQVSPDTKTPSIRATTMQTVEVMFDLVIPTSLVHPIQWHLYLD
jgi:hypothetical protein